MQYNYLRIIGKTGAAEMTQPSNIYLSFNDLWALGSFMANEMVTAH